jgi:Flp pilus assembly protein TadD
MKLFATNKMATLLVLASSLTLGACATDGIERPIASIGNPSAVLPSTDPERRIFTQAWGRRFDADPGDKEGALNYARGLRVLGEYAQAAAVLQQAAIKHPDDLDILGAYGKSLADDGRLDEAAVVLSHAHTPDHPNWSILSAQGAVADRMGDHAQAQRYYQAALKMVPGEPTVLSNLGLSYALDKQLNLAEQTMRQAVSSPGADDRVRQNFALVLALEGKLVDAKDLRKSGSSSIDSIANIAERQETSAPLQTARSIRQPDNPDPTAVFSLASRNDR